MDIVYTKLDNGKSVGLSDLFCKNNRFNDSDYGSMILGQVKKNWNKKKKGYRAGVYLVPINPKFFKSNIVQLKEGDYLFGQFEKRVPKELPRKKICVLGGKPMPIKGVDVVVYSKKVLEEGNENSLLGTDFEILIVLKKVQKGNQPMPPETMMYNFYKANGGTDMKCSDSEFVAQLKESFLFWKDKAIIL